jgi:small subunit ribosomal protein S16
MSVKVRLTRTGANNDLSYRVVATDSRSPRDGRSIEILGWYDPKKSGTNFSLKLDRIDHWVKNGAQMSDTVRSLVRKARKPVSQ